VEGILLFAVPEVYKLFDMKFFVDTDGDIRLLRRIERDIKERSRTLESVRDQYLATVKPMYALYVDPSKQQADMIVPHGGHNQTALALIITRLKDILAKDDPKNRQP
jgi:uridine kinase